MCLWNGDSGTLNSVANVCNLSSGYSQGSTTLVFGSCPTGSISNLHVGSIIKMNQLDDSSDTGNWWQCGNTTCSQQGDSGNVTTGRSTIQMFTVTGISGSNVSVSPAVYAPNWSGGKSPQAGFSSSLPMTGFGLENLTVDTTSLTTGAAMIQFVWATKSWVKNVSLINNTGSGRLDAQACVGGSILAHHGRDSYLYGASPTSEGYGVDFWESGDNLAENNICQHMPTCEIMEGGEGNVFGYHYAVDNFYNGGNFCGGGGTSPCSPNWQQCDQFHHNAGDYYNLWEGGIGICHTEDSIHGTAFANTVFRNALSGFDPAQTPSGPGGVGSPVPKSNNLLTINNMANARYQNYVANVLGWGKPATSFQYVMTSSGDCGPGTPGSGGSPPLVYAMDDSGQVVSAAPCYTAYTVVNDVVANASPSASSMECGNWDAVTSGVHSCQTANSASTYPGLASPSSSYASYPSLYLSSQPSWWVFPSGSVAPWPGIGPEVTGGNISGTSGHAWLNPAANCYLNVLGGGTSGSTGSLQSSFDAATCYPAGAVGGLLLRRSLRLPALMVQPRRSRLRPRPAVPPSATPRTVLPRLPTALGLAFTVRFIPFPSSSVRPLTVKAIGTKTGSTESVRRARTRSTAQQVPRPSLPMRAAIDPPDRHNLHRTSGATICGPTTARLPRPTEREPAPTERPTPERSVWRLPSPSRQLLRRADSVIPELPLLPT